MPTLIYVADPMCSWCYGFGPELAALLTGLPDIQCKIVVGGLRAHNRKAMDQEMVDTILSHWTRVGEASGLPFADEPMVRAGYIYDTEPACRAVKAAQILAPSAAFDVFHTIQHAFYAAGQDMTRATALAEVASNAMTASGIPMDAATFQSIWEAEATIKATDDDFIQVKDWGVGGFPTLVLERNGTLDLVTSGYARTEALVERLQVLVDGGIEGNS